MGQGVVVRKKALKPFADLTNDGDHDGMLFLDRLPTADEAEVIRQYVGVAKKRVLSEEERARLFSVSVGHRFGKRSGVGGDDQREKPALDDMVAGMVPADPQKREFDEAGAERTEWTFHPLADIFPMMDEAALAELAADIKAESQREPILLWRARSLTAATLSGVQARRGRAGVQEDRIPRRRSEALAYVVCATSSGVI